MTAEQFRGQALAIAGATESAHMNHPDFRLGGKIFASLGYPDTNHAMVKLTPESQAEFMRRAPRAFTPCAGAWGRAGSTSVTLVAATVPLVREALAAAAEGFAPKITRSRGPDRPFPMTKQSAAKPKTKAKAKRAG